MYVYISFYIIYIYVHIRIIVRCNCFMKSSYFIIHNITYMFHNIIIPFLFYDYHWVPNCCVA